MLTAFLEILFYRCSLLALCLQWVHFLPCCLSIIASSLPVVAHFAYQATLSLFSSTCCLGDKKKVIHEGNVFLFPRLRAESRFKEQRLVIQELVVSL